VTAVRPIRIAMIGCGRAARELHLPALARVPEIEVVAVAAPSRADVEDVRRRFGIARGATDYAELVDDDSIDAVCVATPTLAHAEPTLAALAAGKHVMVEKPLAVSLDECQRLVEAARGAGVRAAVGYTLRWHPQVTRLRQLVRGGELGEVRLVRSTATGPHAFRDEPAWRSDPAHAGGALAIAGVHHLDLWGLLLEEEVEEVWCEMPESQTEAVLTARTRGGVRISAAFSAASAFHGIVDVYGSRARASASIYRFDPVQPTSERATGGEVGERLRRLFVALGALPAALTTRRRGGVYLAGLELQWRSFLASIRGDEATTCTFEEATQATRVLLAALASAAERRAVPVAEAPRTAPAVAGAGA
jgi:predicted dehydrogenase